MEIEIMSAQPDGTFPVRLHNLSRLSRARQNALLDLVRGRLIRLAKGNTLESLGNFNVSRQNEFVLYASSEEERNQLVDVIGNFKQEEGIEE